MERSRLEIVTYIVAIIAVNIVFLYIRTLVDNRTTITIFHDLFGSLQLGYLLPRIVAYFQNKKAR